MKHTKSLILLFLLLTASCGSAWQTSKESAEEQQQTARMVEQKLAARSYTIDVDYMIPTRGASRAVNSYSVTVQKDTLNSNLPYFGSARNVPYGGGKALTFKDAISKYQDKGHEKDHRTIIITVKNEEDTYEYTLIVFDSGEADIRVMSHNRDNISYRGTLQLTDGEE